jgi:hypothetical protein
MRASAARGTVPACHALAAQQCCYRRQLGLVVATERGRFQLAQRFARMQMGFALVVGRMGRFLALGVDGVAGRAETLPQRLLPCVPAAVPWPVPASVPAGA